MLEADFQRYYQLDLRREVARSGCRRLLVLVRGLPDDAAVWRQDRLGWSHTDELAALQVESGDLWGRILARLWGAKPAHLPAPPQITHPGRPSAPQKAGRKVTTDPAEIRKFFAQHFGR